MYVCIYIYVCIYKFQMEINKKYINILAKKLFRTSLQCAFNNAFHKCYI